MLLLALITLALAGLAVGLLAWGILLPRAHANARLQEIASYGLTSAEPVAERRSAIVALAGHIGEALSERLSGNYEASLRKQLIAAGIYRISARAFLGAQVLSALVLGTLVVLTGLLPGIFAVLLFAFGGAIGWVVPLVLMRRRARFRLQLVERGVPDLIDMLVVTMEAGLGFGASLQAASTRIPGPLGEELRLAMQDQKMGLSLRDALTHMHERASVPNMHSFVRSVSQGEALGVSIGTIMRNLAKEMRVRRRQLAEEQAQKAPVKMLFPLIFLMFPALGIVILGPAIIKVTSSLGS